MFSYLDGFDNICANVMPMEAVKLVNKMLVTFDKLSEKHDVYKVNRFDSCNDVMKLYGREDRDNCFFENVTEENEALSGRS